MTIKEFVVGQTVYVMEDGGSRRPKHVITPAEVVKVGRKYVTISGSWGLRFKEASVPKQYLVEQTEYGAPKRLFPSREAVDDYIEREGLKEWLRAATSNGKIDSYTIEQLRAVKKILEVGNEY